MSVEKNKSLIRRFYEEVANKGNMAVVDELIADEYVVHGVPARAEAPPGPEGDKQIFTMYRTAFPDLRFTFEDQIAEGDKVVTRLTIRGTHQGEFMGIAPTNRPITVTGVSIVRIAGGKLVEGWVNIDMLGMMRQLGVVPKPRQ